MDKINSTSMQHSQLQLLQEMQSVASLSGSNMTPISNGISALNQATTISFSQALKQAVGNVDQQQHIASAMQMAVDTGQSEDLVNTMLESQKANISFSAMIEVRNKLTSALDQVMNISL